MLKKFWMCRLYLGIICFLLLGAIAFEQRVLAGENNALIIEPQYTCLKEPTSPFKLGTEDALNFQCLRESYPEIIGSENGSDGEVWLKLANGQKVPYRAKTPKSLDISGVDAFDVDLATSMAESYPLEPTRPETPRGFAPGRKRSYAFLRAIYGKDVSEIRSALRRYRFLGQDIELNTNSATALDRVQTMLENELRKHPELKRWLKVDGGYAMRQIAGEKRLSPHAYGIALDLSAHIAPYWRWSKKMPHPLQKTYPQVIVKAFEDAGFIWGGKWHEYDMMHFEYRPELICKSRLWKQYTLMQASKLRD